MEKWYKEDWLFTIKVLRVGKRNDVRECRSGLQAGDTFVCSYDTPCGFCPTSFIQMFPLMEAIRSGGDLRNIGGDDQHEMVLHCPDGVVVFKMIGTPANQAQHQNA